MEKICVAIRVRPPTKPESQSAKGHKWRVGPHNVALYSTLGTPVNGQSYSFDHVYGTESKNADIYRGLTKDVIMSALSGFNGTVFAYGQTSSGKTYTMKGTPADPGIIRLAVHDVFSKIQEVASREFLIRVSYMEIYNEEINDLFAPENRRLQIHENLEKGIFVAGLREEIVDSPEQVFNLLEFGESHRHFGETNMNLYSSRSHTIFRMVIESRDMTQDGLEVDSNSDAVRVSALNLVDLAGSERIAKTGAGGVRLKEGTHINKSLMTLGTVINKLSEGPGKQGGHIPYRDSKLTRILQPALGGNAKTAMICTVTPDEIHIDETRGTLQFASRAKKVTNCAQVNEILTDAALLKRQTREIEDLRSKLQGLPQSEHLEKEILNLRNELLKYELEKERLFLELQEEKKAQIDRERRIKEQEQKIENLSTLFMSSNVDDRDNEKQAKKVNRRETWCPRQLNSDLSAQDFSWKLAGKHIEDEAMDNILYSMRRDRHFDLPPAFDTLVDDEAWNDSNAIEEPPPPTDFENIADEDTWMSLNKGHTTSSTVFTSSFFERSRSSGGNSEAEKLASLEADLKNLQEKYEDLRRNFDLKLQESTTELVLDVENSKKRLEKVLEENGSLRSDLRKMRSENAALTHELNAQLESQRRLRSAVEDVECEMDAARLLTSSLQGILVDSLHVQAVVVQNIQECFATSPPKGRVGNSAIDYKAKKVRERRALVENSVQKCRDICADVDVAVQNRLAQLNIGSERSLEAHAYDSGRQVMEKNPTHSVPDTRDAQTQAMFGPRNNGSDAQSSSPCELTYCGGCVSSALSAGNMHDFEQGSLSKEQNLKCECDLIAETHSRVMKLLRGSVGGNDYLSHVGRDRLTSVKCAVDMGFASFSPDCTEVDAKSSLHISTHKHSTPSVHQAGLDGEEPESIWRDFISCPHIGCSFGTLGRNCDRCGHQERAFIGENQIPLAMSNLCRHILKLLNPSLKLEDVRSEGGVRDVPVIEDINLKARLASAKVLTSWLFEELRSILAHDVHCLKSHVKERGSVGLLMEGLQVMLLENASLAIGLMQATCQDENSMNDLILRLQGLKDVFNTVPTVEAELTKAGMETEKHEQTETPIQITQVAAPKEQTFSTISSMDASTKISPGAVPARVLKLEGVEEMLGELLQYSMLRLLNREQQMVKGSTLFIVLTVGLQPTSIFSDGPLQLQLCVENIKEIGSAGRSDHQSDSLKPGEMFRQQPSPGLQSGTCVAMTGAVRRVRTKKHEVTAADMQTWNIGGNCDQKQLEVSNCDQYPKAKTIQQFTWRTIDSEEKLRDQLLIEVERVKELERSLASSEMEVVELKIELEDLRMQMCEVTTQHGTEFQFELELEALKIQCENYEEEIRLILEQVPTVDDDLRRERKLIEVTEENVFLRNCLTKAEKRLSRRKARRTTSTTTTHTRVSEENLKDEDVAVSFSRVHHAGSPVKVDGQTILSPVVNSVDRPRHGEICDQDLKVSGLLREVEMLREQLATQDIKPTPQKPSYSVVDAQAREYDGASKPDICKTDKGNITPHDFPRSVRSALGELELNGRNANAACRNPKRRRQQSVNEYSSNKENLVNYR
ncbi:centromeric protein E [Marchantia polymorpha subsp. ruderalis]|uniref:Kinesin motor domain-containing protein n=2 Tax=Marchantia polymorpha TaxID=3197 RepID=A0AAF6BNB5_MARPO|nr:hypothetical protein MARPO_0034s0119 [Marchantia polymorpha]BBN13499.1 hypothetical protein Mp_6g03980 [Marchantia polymorpha subsp. ruderalis]|eukprot:PTQ41541.1 hypothetical protein MARPO_0034s0119 [Marchantia polymorpha]